jgi:hypothetical protein
MAARDPRKAAARADLCRFLAACYYELGPEFAEEKLFHWMLLRPGRAVKGPEVGGCGESTAEPWHRAFQAEA